MVRWRVERGVAEQTESIVNGFNEVLYWKWRNDRRSEHNLCNCVKKPEKNSGLQRGLNPWPRDTGAMLYQLSYEATDVGSRSIVGSYVPVKEMSVNDIWNKSYMNSGNEMKMKKWSSQWTQFMQLRKEAWKKKIQDFNGVWTRDLAIPVRCSTDWAMKPSLLKRTSYWYTHFQSLWSRICFMVKVACRKPGKRLKSDKARNQSCCTLIWTPVIKCLVFLSLGFGS